jgi:hypothetical protein
LIAATVPMPTKNAPSNKAFVFCITPPPPQDNALSRAWNLARSSPVAASIWRGRLAYVVRQAFKRREAALDLQQPLRHSLVVAASKPGQDQLTRNARERARHGVSSCLERLDMTRREAHRDGACGLGHAHSPLG